MTTKDMMMDKIATMHKNGYSEKDIADFFGLSVGDLRLHISIRNRDNRICLSSMAKELKEEGKEVSEIAKIMDKTEAGIRFLLSDE